MMKHIILTLVSLLIIFSASAQTYTLSGVIKDAEIGETLIGANIQIGVGIGTITDFDGYYSMEVKKGEYTVSVSYVGYEATEKKITINKNTILNFSLNTITLAEVNVVADMARSRETPVAFTNVLPAKIEEELGGQDLPMVLNSTPGVYATQQGGGDGDARITIRGFSQRNVAVMLDGIPVNDMENGWVYWSNWFGLEAVTRNMQVQRGLAASKLALPSVGGTINIITSGIANKKKTTIKQSIDSEGKSRTSIGFNSGQLKNGWGFTLAGSYKNGDGYADETWSKACFYYAKIDKRIGNHIVSVTAMGAPQEHGQRGYTRAIATYDSTYATSLGVDTFPKNIDYGYRYNQQWGDLDRWEYGNNITDSLFNPATQSYNYYYDTIHNSNEKTHYKINKYHKPAFSLRDFWTVNDKLYISNILYLSVGHGGGTSTKNSLKDTDLDSESGQINWQSLYDANMDVNFPRYAAIDGAYSYDLRKASQYRVISMNDHFWYGLLSTLNYKYDDNYTFSGGVDLRSYKGSHYREVYDLLGGEYCVDNYNANQDTAVKKVGDKVYYYDDAYVRWGGLFGQMEYKAGNISYFINLSLAESGFMKEDYFAAEYVYTTDEFGNTIKEDNPERNSGWLWKTSYTAKGGFNYNITDKMNAFINMGYLSKTRASSYLYNGYVAEFREDTDNEIVKAIEIGYSYNSSVFAANVNLYNTLWEGKPIRDIDVGDDNVARIDGIDLLHRGIEVDFIYKIMSNLALQGIVSLGDWRYNTKIENVPVYDINDQLVPEEEFDFNAQDIHVGDAAQTQFGGSLRYEPFKKFYVNVKYTYFDRYYADLEPSSLNGEGNAIDADGNPRESWRIPDYGLVDFNTGYTFKFDKFRMSLRLTVLNILDKVYISDARNNDQYIYGTPPNQFDAASAGVFFGLGRRFSTSVKFTF